MKAVILAGGLGTRLSEETEIRPKPMIEIGGRPILWHIMKIYSTYRVREFVICCGYKGHLIKEYFANYFLHTSDITIDIQKNSITAHQGNTEPWSVTLVDTGEDTQTGGRLKRVQSYVGDEPFFFTYGDGVSNINIDALAQFHRMKGSIATLSAVQPPGRFGAVALENGKVREFREKPTGDDAFINGGFFVLEPEVFGQLRDDSTSFENYVLPRLAASGELAAFVHTGFWLPMDTLRDKRQLETLWQDGNAPWKVWDTPQSCEIVEQNGLGTIAAPR